MVTETEYKIQLQSVFNLAALVRGLKIQEILDAMNWAETLGPVLDPSLYQMAANQFGWQKETVEAALAFQKAIERIANDSKYQPDQAQ